MQQPNQSMNQPSKSRKQFVSSGPFCRSFIEQLFKLTFEGVGIQNAKRMAPKNTHLQTMQAMQSFVSMAFTEKIIKNLLFVDQKDFRPPVIDNLAVNQIETEKYSHISLTSPMPSINESALTTKSNLRTKKSDLQRSVHSRRFTQISEEPHELKSKLQKSFQKLPQLPGQFDYSEDNDLNKVRNNYLKMQRQVAQQQKELQVLRQKGLSSKQHNQKLAKDTKKYTYDYEGKVISQGNGATQQQKILTLNNRFSQLKRLNQIHAPMTAQIKIETSGKRDREVKTDRKELKELPMFREKTLSIIENIQSDKGIAAGVKIIEELGKDKSLTKENKLKKPVIHSLVEFKNSTKESRFKEYRPVSLHNKSSLNASSLNNEQTSIRTNLQKPKSRRSMFNKDHKSLSSYTLNDSKIKGVEMLEELKSSRLERSILGSIDQRISEQKQKIKYRGLPFIKTKGYKAVDIESQTSFKFVLDQLGENSRQMIRSKIRINDLNLLRTALEDL